jgi:hypothetical protein
MPECILDINKIGKITRNQLVFFATHDYMIYKSSSILVHSSCGDEIINTNSLPRDCNNYECLEFDDIIIFVFAGKEVVIIDKSGHQPIAYKIDHRKIGRIYTRLLASPHEPNHVIFGTRWDTKVQFMCYDFMDQSRICQTSSWDMDRINYICTNDQFIYALLDSTFIVCADMSTGETAWTRFEAGVISANILAYGNSLLYACHNVLKIITNNKVENINIPLVKIHTLECIVGNNLYFTSNQGYNIGSYDLLNRRVNWEIPGNFAIKETLLTKGFNGKEIHDVLLLRMHKRLGVIDLTQGKSVHFTKINNISKMRITHDHILLHKSIPETDIIPGLTKEDTNVNN